MDLAFRETRISDIEQLFDVRASTRENPGKQLLARTVNGLRSGGATRIWLAASPDPLRRAYGFYRAQGWQPTGERTSDDEEILVLESARSLQA
jgi:hypothetical protein